MIEYTGVRNSARDTPFAVRTNLVFVGSNRHFQAGANSLANTYLLFLEVNDKIDQMMGQLPSELPRPRVVESNIADVPVLVIRQ